MNGYLGVYPRFGIHAPEFINKGDTTHTLEYAPGGSFAITVVVGGVPQEPMSDRGGAYSVDDRLVTFAEPLPSDGWIIYNGIETGSDAYLFGGKLPRMYVTKESQYRELARIHGYTLVSEWMQGVTIPDNAMTDKKCWWHDASGMLITPATDTSFVTTEWSTDQSNWIVVGQSLEATFEFSDYVTMNTRSQIINHVIGPVLTEAQLLRLAGDESGASTMEGKASALYVALNTSYPIPS